MVCHIAKAIQEDFGQVYVILTISDADLEALIATLDVSKLTLYVTLFCLV